MATPCSFSSSGEEAIQRELEGLSLSEKEEKTEEDIRKYYEIDRCLEFVSTRENVALQFPDHLLQDSATVALIIQQESGKDVFILGDTSYGSCCVDEVAAEHVGSEGIIHFGPSCLTELPVLYVFGREMIGVEDCIDKFKETFPDRAQPIVILYDVIYSHTVDILHDNLMSLYSELVISQLHITTPTTKPVASDGTTSDGCVLCGCDKNRCDGSNERESSIPSTSNNEFTFTRFGRDFNITRPFSEYKVFFIGSESATLTNFMLTYSSNQFYLYNPSNKTCQYETKNINKMLGHRYYLIQKAKEAKTVGILVGTLGTVNYIAMIERLQCILKKAGKKSYIIAVGKLNSAKLANFMEIQIFVLVSCPHCSLIDSQEYYQPIVTPYEMEVACLRQWTGNVIIDYQQLLPEGDSHVAMETSTNNSIPEFSFLSGQLLPTNEEGVVNNDDDNTVVTKSSTDVSLPYSGASYLQSRSWQGLERQSVVQEDIPVADTVQGRAGLPILYTHETL